MNQSSRFGAIADNGKSVGEQITDTLRKAIILRRLRLGERLVESKLAAELNVSITPVRYAFQILASEGLIEVFPYKGSYVTTITRAFIKDICVCRSIVELGAAEHAYEVLAEKNSGALMQLLMEGVEAFKRTGDIMEVIAKDQLFHKTVLMHCPFRTLLDFWKRLSPRIMLLQSYAKRESYDVNQFRERHLPLAEALARKAGKEVFVDALRENLEMSYSEEEIRIILEEAGQVADAVSR